MLLGLLICVSCTAANAQSYPDRVIRLVVPYSAGGPTDTVARLVANELQGAFGKSVIVENRPGGNGTIGLDVVAKAKPDGYTLLFGGAGPLVLTPHLQASLPYSSLGAFQAIGLVGVGPIVLVVNKNVKAGTLQELIKESRDRSLTYASGGTGSTAHLAAEMFKAAAAVDLLHVGYKGSAPALSDFYGGQVDVMTDVVGSVLPYITAKNNIRALAISGSTRSELLPDVPTFLEAGVVGVDASTWFGVLGPAGLPPEIVTTLSRALDGALQKKSLREALKQQGVVPTGSSPEQFATYMNDELGKWGKVIKQAGIKAE